MEKLQIKKRSVRHSAKANNMSGILLELKFDVELKQESVLSRFNSELPTQTNSEGSNSFDKSDCPKTNVDGLIWVPLNLKYHGFDYTQIYRGGRSCLYRQSYEEKTIGFEVFVIKIQPETLLYGKLYKAHELWPKDNDFGKTAWTYFTLEDALRKYKAIEG